MLNKKILFGFAFVFLFSSLLNAQGFENASGGAQVQPPSAMPSVNNVQNQINSVQKSPNYESYANLALDYFPLMRDSLHTSVNLGFFQLDGGLGTVWFDNQQYYEIALRPVFTFWKFRFGLRGELRFNKDWKIRTEDWSQGVLSYLRLLDFVEYGSPYDVFYARFGSMDRLTLGNGSIVNMYSNTAGYDLRRPGIQIRLNFPVWGLQIFTSDVTNLAIFGTRIYTRPFYSLHIPLVSSIEIGGSVVTDVRSQSGLIAADNNKLGKSQFLKSTSKQELPLVFGFDLTLPIVQFSFWDLKVVADYVNFLGKANGLSAGIINTFNIANIVNLSVRFEHRENFKGVAFGYFDGFYEISRYQVVGVTGDTIATAWNSAKSTEAWRGFKASLALNVMSKIVGVAGYERRYDSPVGGRFFAYLEAPNLLPSFALRAEYFKRDTDFNLSLFSIDDRSTARLIASYSFNFIMLSVISQWSFTPETNASGAIIGYVPQQILFFRTGVNFQF